jgi:hypothetical protein
MGEARNWLFEPSFNRSIKVRRTDQRLTSDAGVEELDEIEIELRSDQLNSGLDG